jgi:hypothetical protein
MGESRLAVADVTTGAARVIVAPGTRNVRERSGPATAAV